MTKDFMPYLKTYMLQLAQFHRDHSHGPYFGLEDFLLREGEAMRGPVKNYRIKKGTPKECFKNAMDRVRYHNTKGYKYAEGLTMSEQLPVAIHHAWLVNAKGEAIDPTLGWREGSVFYGVVFSPDDAWRRCLQQRFYGLLSGDMMYTDIVLGTDPDFPYKDREV